jgi:hypothetical protein
VSETDETYFRKYLMDTLDSDPTSNYVPETDVVQGTETADTAYFRKYLADPNA